MFPGVKATWRVADQRISENEQNSGGDEFLTQYGIQNKFIKALYERLTKKRDSSHDYSKDNVMAECKKIAGPWDGGRPKDKKETLVK